MPRRGAHSESCDDHKWMMRTICRGRPTFRIPAGLEWELIVDTSWRQMCKRIAVRDEMAVTTRNAPGIMPTHLGGPV